MSPILDDKRAWHKGIGAAVAEMKIEIGWKKFGNDLRKYRNRLGIGLRECARDLRVNYSTWCRAEQGKSINASHFLFLCEWMKCEPTAYAKRHP
jgi:hypothetical protein